MKKARGYHHGDLPRALIDAVVAHVIEHGGAGELTLREAARRAGVSHNAVYRHFAHKGALLAAVAVEGFGELSRALRAARAGIDEAEERFVQTGLAYVRFARERRGHAAVMFGPEIAKGKTRALQLAANDTFQVLKELAADAGIHDVVHARRHGTVAWSFVHGLAALGNQQQIPRSVDAAPDALADLGLRHLFRAFRAARAENAGSGAERGRAEAGVRETHV